MRTKNPAAPTLRSIRRDVRVAARSVRLAASLRVREDFAAAMMARYAACTTQAPPLEMVLRRQVRRLLGQSVIDARRSVRITPKLIVNLVPANALASSIVRHAYHTHTDRTRIVMPGQRVERTLVVRLTEREVRREVSAQQAGAQQLARESSRISPPPATPPPGLPLANPSAALPVRRIFRRVAPPAAKGEPAMAEPPRTMQTPQAGDVQSFSRSARSYPGESISPIELNRITDHVMETIDRQITASRERRGRR